MSKISAREQLEREFTPLLALCQPEECTVVLKVKLREVIADHDQNIKVYLDRLEKEQKLKEVREAQLTELEKEG